MPDKNADLDGNVPDESGVALLLIDIINDFEYPGGEALFAQALPMAQRLAALKQRARQAGIPAIYVNDNFGKWRSDFPKLIRHCLDEDVLGRPVVRLLHPDPEDYFVLKPKHSGFYGTPLDLLLAYLKVSTLILTGVAGDVCVLFTASDAFMRDYHLFVPADCVASIDPKANRHALEQMQRTLEVDIRPSTDLDPAALKRQAESKAS